MRAAIRHRVGFTLIELLIVICVISMLALIVVPRVLGAGRKAREASLRGNLRQLRGAIEQFQSDTGVYPKVLADLVAPRETDVLALIPRDSYKGPYLTPRGGIGGKGVPLNPFSRPTSPDEVAHWKYSASTGLVSVPDSQAAYITADEMVPFSNL